MSRRFKFDFKDQIMASGSGNSGSTPTASCDGHQMWGRTDREGYCLQIYSSQ